MILCELEEDMPLLLAFQLNYYNIKPVFLSIISLLYESLRAFFMQIRTVGAAIGRPWAIRESPLRKNPTRERVGSQMGKGNHSMAFTRTAAHKMNLLSSWRNIGLYKIEQMLLHPQSATDFLETLPSNPDVKG